MIIKKKHNEIRKSKMRNLACTCGATKPNPEFGKSPHEPAEIPVKYKHCCGRKNWPQPQNTFPNVLGSYVKDKSSAIKYVVRNSEGKLFKTFRNQAIWTDNMGEARRYRTLDDAQETVKSLKDHNIEAEVSANV